MFAKGELPSRETRPYVPCVTRPYVQFNHLMTICITIPKSITAIRSGYKDTIIPDPGHIS